MTSAIPVATHEPGEERAARPLTMFGPDFPFAYDDWLSPPRGPGVGARGRAGHRGGGHRRRAVGDRHRLRADEAGAAPGGLRGPRDRRAAALGRLRRAPGRGRRDGRDALPAVLDRLLLLRGPAGAAHHPVPQPAGRRDAEHGHRPQGRDALRRDAGRPARDLPPGGGRLARDAGARRRAGGDAGGDPERDTKLIKAIWDELVEQLDDTTFYGFLAASPAFRSFRHREVFGQVGFGTGGWDTDFPNSILEILRVVYTAADDDHRSIVGGSQQVPVGLWSTRPTSRRTGRPGTTLASLHPGGRPLPAVTRLHRTAGDDSPSPTPPGRSAPTGPRCSPRRAGCCCPGSPATTACSRSTTGRRSSDPLHGVDQAVRAWSTGRSGPTSTRRPAGTG